MRKAFIIAYYTLVASLLALADSRGLILSGIGRGGMGRSHSSFGHK
jgi:hypothetical protein